MKHVALAVSIFTAVFCLVMLYVAVDKNDEPSVVVSIISGFISIICIQAHTIMELKEQIEFTNYMNNNGL